MKPRDENTDGHRLLLVVDYPGRREEARIADLQLEGRGFDVRYLMNAAVPELTEAAAYARELLSRHDLTTSTPDAVLAYCMAAPLGQEIAALLSRTSPVPLILFDGEPSTAEAVQEQYRLARQQLAMHTPAQADEHDPTTTIDDARLAARPNEILTSLRQTLVRLGTRTFSSQVADDEAAQTAGALAEHFMRWLTYLVAAHNTTWPSWGGQVLHVVSATHHYAAGWPGAGSTQVVPVPSTRLELLRRRETAAAVDAFLASGGRPTIGRTP